MSLMSIDADSAVVMGIALKSVACAHCAKDHETKTCPQIGKIKACINCITANKFIPNPRKTDHEAGDQTNCDTYKVKWERMITTTDYPFRPSFDNTNGRDNRISS